jgi:putative oxidoreductase
MNPRQTLNALEGGLAAAAGCLAAPLQFATRLWVGWVFLKSGWLKVGDWSQTLALFETEYRVPLLSPHAAAYAGAGGELVFGSLVILGLAGRAGALGLFAVNLMAFISYRHVLLGEGFEAALGQHVLWGFMLLVLVVHGPGSWSLDRLLRTVPAPLAGRATVA